MVDSNFLQLVCSHASIKTSDIVLEVGAGFGFLTHLLAQKAKEVIAVESDIQLQQALQKEFALHHKVKLVSGDIFKVVVPRFDKAVSNPPFSISSPLLFWLLNHKFECAILTFQEQFAQRLQAKPGSNDYSRLTVSTFYRAEVELLDRVPREAFYPKPKVDAVIARLKPRSAPPFEVKNQRIFDEVLRSLFTQRNKKVRNAMLPLFRKFGLTRSEAFQIEKPLPFQDKRVRVLEPNEFGVLANALSAKEDLFR